MNRKVMVVGVAVSALCALFALGACSSGADKPASTAPSSEASAQASTQQSTAESTEDSQKVAIDEAAIIERAASAVQDNQVELFGDDAAEHWVLTQNVVKTDLNDPNDLKVYGAYELDGFNLEDRTMVCEAASVVMCLVHISAGEDGAYEIEEIEMPSDGLEQQDDLLKICGDDKQLVKQMNAASNFADGEGLELRKAAIAEYAEANGLDAIAYQDVGQDPAKL